MLTMYSAMGGWDFVGKFATQLDGKVESSSTNVPKKVADGELPLGITLE
jgi:iron(III) transport system substrate-binding protein